MISAIVPAHSVISTTGIDSWDGNGITVKNALKLRTPITTYPGSQAPFWGEEVTSPAIVVLNTFLVRLCHPIEGLGGLLAKFFWRDG